MLHLLCILFSAEKFTEPYIVAHLRNIFISWNKFLFFASQRKWKEERARIRTDFLSSHRIWQKNGVLDLKPQLAW